VSADRPGFLTDVPGVAVGHWTDPVARTGCTVVTVPEGTVASGEIRGGGPASRELALLEPNRNVASIDAVVLTGGSAFGLAAADGVMRFLEETGRGYVTPAGRVPIVPTMGLYDLAVGDASVRPDAAAGRAAAESATTDDHGVGLVGAGTGCTTAKWLGREHAEQGGLVAASTRVGQVTVACLVAVNAVGSVGHAATLEDDGSVPGVLGRTGQGEHTTIGVVATSARLDKVACRLLAESAHDGLARAVFPTHTRFDGDAFVACATGTGTEGDGSAGIDTLRIAATVVVEQAILSLAP
jgi:L-aminopeptidase/D-esterase-like protein